LDEVLAAGKSMEEFVALALKNLSSEGRPYFKKFVEEDFTKDQKELIISTEPTKQEVQHGGTQPGRAKETTPGETGGGMAEPGSTVAGSPDLVDGVQAEAGTGYVGEKPEAVGAEGVEGGAESVAAGNDIAEGGIVGQGPDTGSDTLKVSESDRRAAAKREAAKQPVEQDTGVVGQPGPGIQRQPELKEEDQNHVIESDDVVFPAGNVTKIKANIAAIRLIKKLESEDRNPTKKEKKVLAKYVGWGQFSQKHFFYYTRLAIRFSNYRSSKSREKQGKAG